MTGVNRNTYSYDPVGNRTVLKRQTGTRVTYSYDAANQMTRFLDAGVPVTFSYDQAGNTLTQKNTTQPFNTTMTWDAENRLRTYHQAGVAGGNNFNQRLTHTYNGDGLRVERAATGGPTNARFVWDRQNIHLKLNTSNALVDYYVYELREFGNLVATGSSARTHHYDPLSSTTALSTSGGTVGEVYSYTPWGEISAPDPLNSAVDPFLYIGRMGYYSDDEGINKNSTSPLLPFQVRARFYNPIWARWISPDPLGYNAIDPHLYRYVRNSPINIVDPSGLRGLPTRYPRTPPSGRIDQEFCTFLDLINGTCCTVGQTAVFQQRCEAKGEELYSASCYPRCNLYSCVAKRKDCDCFCIAVDGRGVEHGPYQQGKTSKRDCQRIPETQKGKDLNYVRCFCKD